MASTFLVKLQAKRPADLWKNDIVIVAFLWVFQNCYFCTTRVLWMASSKKCFTPQILLVFYPKMVKLPPFIKKSFNQSLKEQLVMRITKIWALISGLVNLVSLFKINLVFPYRRETSLSRFVIVLRNKINFYFEMNNLPNLYSWAYLCYCSRICKQFSRLSNQTLHVFIY